MRIAGGDYRSTTPVVLNCSRLIHVRFAYRSLIFTFLAFRWGRPSASTQEPEPDVVVARLSAGVAVVALDAAGARPLVVAERGCSTRLRLHPRLRLCFRGRTRLRFNPRLRAGFRLQRRTRLRHDRLLRLRFPRFRLRFQVHVRLWLNRWLRQRLQVWTWLCFDSFWLGIQVRSDHFMCPR